MSRFIELRGTGDEGLGNTNRVWIKSFMEQFGKVLTVHKPPSTGNPEEDVAFIRFAKEEEAEKAIQTLKKGDELLMGRQVVADWKGNPKGRGRSSGASNYNTPTDDSRTLALGRDRRRSRSRSWQDSRAYARGDRGRDAPRRDDSRGRDSPRHGGGPRRDDSRDGRGQPRHQRFRREDSRDRRGVGKGARRSDSRDTRGGGYPRHDAQNGRNREGCGDYGSYGGNGGGGKGRRGDSRDRR